MAYFARRGCIPEREPLPYWPKVKHDYVADGSPTINGPCIHGVTVCGSLSHHTLVELKGDDVERAVLDVRDALARSVYGVA